MITYRVFGVPALPAIRAGDDLAALIATHAVGEDELRTGDIVVVTSKIVSKAEGRVRTGVDRDDAIDAETVRVVSEWTTPRGRTRIAQTRHGFVMAAAGVDASNVERGSVVLLPENPDASARRIRAGLRERLGAEVGVIVADTFGRPWRDGVVDVALGAAGVIVRDDLRGQSDPYGNELGVTVVAVADELASATELVRGKLAGVPVAVIRGLAHLVTADDGAGVAALIRPADEDRFRLGTPEAMREAVFARRDVHDFAAGPVDPEAIRRAVAAALSAPSVRGAPPHGAPPHGSLPWRFVLVREESTRIRLFDAMLDAWVRDLRADGLDEARIASRTYAGEALRRAPYLIVPCLVSRHSPSRPDQRRSHAEASSDLLGAGAAVENLLVALAAEGLGSWWSHAPLYCPDIVRDVLELPADWAPVGAVAVGFAAGSPPAHPTPDPDEFTTVR